VAAMNYQNQKGQALVEFALVLPLLVMILAGLVDFGFLFYNKQVIANASREGARAGIVYLLNTDGTKKIPDIDAVVQKYCENKRLITFGASSGPTTTFTDTSLNYDSDMTVTVNFTYTFLLSGALNIFGGNFGPTLDISATTTMKME
jgi:Flp pilus assembly protein TadG